MFKKNIRLTSTDSNGKKLNNVISYIQDTTLDKIIITLEWIKYIINKSYVNCKKYV